MKKIILASKSKARIKILQDSGINFEAVFANVDEDKVKKECFLKKMDTESIAITLAKAKAVDISSKNHNKLVIGADQILECGGILFNKAKDFDEVYQTLKFLKNKSHYLINGITICLNGEVVFSFSNKINMVMRDFSDEFLRKYVENNQEIIHSVGCYCIEGEGIQLFSKIDNDYFSILGLPLMPILDFLREKEVILK